MKDESTPLVNPLLSKGSTDDKTAGASSEPEPIIQAAQAFYARTESHMILHQKKTDPGLEHFKHDPAMLYSTSPNVTERRLRSQARQRYVTPNSSLMGCIQAVLLGNIRSVTVFSSQRLIFMIVAHLLIAGGLATGYTFVDLSKDDRTDFLSGTKDFADLCVTGIVFLLGGFVTTMLTRWWAFRTQCTGALHQACVNLNMYCAVSFPTASTVHREARALVARYSLAAMQLLFIEGRMGDLAAEAPGQDHGLEAVRGLAASGTLKPEEVAVLEHLPVRSAVVVSWIAAFFDKVMDPNGGLACTHAARNADNGRYSVLFGQVFAARNAISMCHMYMQTQLPYGYIHLILIVVQITCLANSIFCGIHLGQMIKTAAASSDAPEVLIPLFLIRFLRIVLVPLLLDGMLLIGSVIAQPLGDDEDDFPAGAFLEALEDECLAPGAALEQYHPVSSLTKKEDEKK